MGTDEAQASLATARSAPPFLTVEPIIILGLCERLSSLRRSGDGAAALFSHPTRTRDSDPFLPPAAGAAVLVLDHSASPSSSLADECERDVRRTKPLLHGAHRWGDRDQAREALRADGGGGKDRLSALPEDVLIHILLKLRDASVAARTSVLSSCWRRLWALMPSLEFSDAQDSHRIRSALAAHDAPVLRCLHVLAKDASADSVAAWLPIAARRLSGDLTFINTSSRQYREIDGEIDAFQLPCFENATSIRLDTDLGLASPPSGVFARLTELYLDCIQLVGTCGLGDVVSSPRCPALRKLMLWDAHGMGKFTVRSESLLHVELDSLEDLQQLTIVTPVLEELTVISCFIDFPIPNQLFVNISAPRLLSLGWNGDYDPCSVQFDEMALLQRLCNVGFFVYSPDFTANDDSLRLLRHFKVIKTLFLILFYRSNIRSIDLYLMEDMPRLPHISFLSLEVINTGHSFGASLFHILRVCTGVRKLALKYFEDTPCPSGCICDQQRNWKTEELVLDLLQEVEIIGLTGSGHQVAFMERLFSWATMLNMVTVSFHESIAENKAKGLCQILRSFSSPEICMQFYVFDGLVKKVLYVPEE